MQPTAPSLATTAEPIMLAVMRLSPGELRLYGADGSTIALERKAFDLLAHLVVERHRVVGKEELLQAVWGRSIASDSVIAQAVSKARKALVHGGGEADWIDVARGVGYRYIGPAEVVIPTAPVASSLPQPSPARPSLHRRWLIAAVILVAISAGLATWWQQRVAQRDPLRIAVMPWRNDTGDNDLEWTRFGLQGLIVEALASDRRVVPIAQTDVRVLLAARPDLADADAQAEYLSAATGADHVLAGRLSRDGDGLHVELVVLGSNANQSARLIGTDAATTALAASTGLTRPMLPGFDPMRAKPLSDDAFANEAYARGVDARLRGDAQSAARHLQAAIAADPAMLAARYQLSIAFQLMRRNDEWRSTLDDLLALSRARDDRTHEAMALSGQGLLAWREGRLDDAEALLHAAGEHFDESNDVLRRAGVEGNLGSLAAMRAEFDTAETAMRRALAAYEQAGQQVSVARVCKNLGILNLDRGRHDEAARWIERSLAIRQSLRLERDLAESLTAMASIDLAREQPAAAQASYERAATIFARFNDPLLESDSLARMVNALVAQGRLQAAADAAARSLASARLADNAAALGLAHQKLAWVARLRDDTSGSRAHLEQAQAHYRRIDQKQGLIRVALERAELDSAGNHSPETLTMIDTALAGAREHGFRVLVAEALLLRARTSDSTRARIDLAEALEIGHAIGEGDLITQISCAMVRIGLGDDDLPNAPVDRCIQAATRSAEAAAALADRAESTGDFSAAARWLRQHKSLAGEAWNSDDESRLARLDLLPSPR